MQGIWVWDSATGAAEKGAELPNAWIVASTAPEEPYGAKAA
jgi:hypothetical protein